MEQMSDHCRVTVWKITIFYNEVTQPSSSSVTTVNTEICYISKMYIFSKSCYLFAKRKFVVISETIWGKWYITMQNLTSGDIHVPFNIMRN